MGITQPRYQVFGRWMEILIERIVDPVLFQVGSSGGRGKALPGMRDPAG